MDNFLRGQSALYKLTAISVAGLLLGFGLCGIGMAVNSDHAGEFFFIVGPVLFWLSALGLVVSVTWAVIKGLIEGRRRQR